MPYTTSTPEVTVVASKLNSRKDDMEKAATTTDSLARFFSWLARTSCRYLVLISHHSVQNTVEGRLEEYEWQGWRLGWSVV